MKTRIKYSDNNRMWYLENELKAKGFQKTSDCYWVQIYTNGKDEVMLERE